MRKIMLLITVLVLGGLSVSATTTNQPSYIDNISAFRGYGNTFIFVENGIEFSIFPDGQFDFYMPSYGPTIQTYGQGITISFNSGYNYNPFLQYDEYGAIIQVEHVPVYYDFYGRVARIGNVIINYNGYGHISRIGGLYIHYNSYRTYSHYSGYINALNPHYVFRPWHTYYRVPAFNHCVVYHKPYRMHYTPIRYNYNTPYTNNYSRTTAVASRRGNTITRQPDLATGSTRANNTPRREVETAKTRSNNQVASNPRGNTNTVRPRQELEVNTTRPNGQATSNPRENTDPVRPRQRSEVNSPRVTSPLVSQPKIQNRGNTMRPEVKNNISERQVTSNTRGRR